MENNEQDQNITSSEVIIQPATGLLPRKSYFKYILIGGAILIALAIGGAFIFYSQKTTVSVKIIMDQNDNGIADLDEHQLQTATVSIESVDNKISKITKSSGHFIFEKLPRYARQGSWLPKPVTYTITLLAQESCFELSHQNVALIPNDKITDIHILASYSCLSGKIFLDNNGNGKQNNDDKLADYISSLSYTKLTLTPENSNGTPTTITAGTDGTYGFSNIPRFQARPYPELELIHYNLSSVADCYRPTGVSDPIVFVPKKSTDIGLAYSCLSGVAYHDRNGNGKVDPKDDGLKGATVQLHIPGQQTIATSTTVGRDGVFLFKNLDSSNYDVTVTKDYFNTVTTQPFLMNLNPNSQAKIGMNCSCVEGWVFLDSNSNQIFDKDEKGLPNFNVGIGLPKRSKTWSTKTSTDGYYIIPNLELNPPDGPYLMGIALGLDYESVNNRQDFSVIIPPDALLNVPLRPRKDNQTLGGTVFLDANRNGVQDAGEQGMSEIQVGLFNGSGSQAPTQADGSFSFPGNYSGYYTFSLRVPQGYTTTGADEAGFVNRLINVNSGTQPINIALVPSSKSQATANGSTTYQVYGTVFEDLNNNGRIDSGEPPVSGYTIGLFQLDSAKLQITGKQSYMHVDTQGQYSTDLPQSQTDFTPTGGIYHLMATGNSEDYIPTTPADLFFMLNANKQINFGVHKK